MDQDRREKFERMFFPKSLAIVGISRTDPGLGGQFFLKNLRRAQYPGRVYLVHPTASEIGGLRAYASLSVLPDPVDLALGCAGLGPLGGLWEKSRKGNSSLETEER